MTQSRPCTATMLVDTGLRPIPVLGWEEDSDHVGSISLTGTTAGYITGLKENEIYELSFVKATDLLAGRADNIYIRPGGVTSTAAVTTSSYLWNASKVSVVQIKLQGDQQSIGLKGTGSNTKVSWRRCT